MRLRTLMTLTVMVAACAIVPSVHAMDRWAALSMIESGNDDQAIGSVGEVSRFQIRPTLWPGGNPGNANLALGVARRIMEKRINQFEQTHNRPPTDFEFYVLWNAPQQVNHPRKVVAERAHRYANLVELATITYANR